MVGYLLRYVSEQNLMKTITILTLSLVLSAAYSRADVIYQDTFSEGSADAPVLLDGQKPSTDPEDTTYSATDNGLGSAGTYEVNGSEVVVQQGNVSGAFLPFSTSYLGATTPTSGTLTLSATVSNSGGDNGGWASLGFTDGGSYQSSDSNAAYSSGEDWMIFTSNTPSDSDPSGNGFALFLGPATNNNVAPSTSVAPSTTLDLEIQLDLATNEVSYYEGTSASDLTLLGTYTNPSDVSVDTYTGVQLYTQGNSAGTETFDNLSLTYNAVPEPSSLALIAVSLGVWGVLRWRKLVS